MTEQARISPTVQKIAAQQLSVFALCTASGALAATLNIPAGWLCGSLAMSAWLSFTGRSALMLPALRDFAMILSGLSIGLSVTPETVARFATIPLSLSIMIVAVIAITSISALILMRFFGWRRLDACLASAPGALSTILIIASEKEAELSKIVVIQLFRLFMLMAVLPSVVTAGFGHAAVPVHHDQVWLSPEGLALVCGAGLLLALVFVRIQLPAPILLGAMLAAGLLNGSGFVAGQMPSVLSNLSFALVGWFIGERFRGVKLRDIRGLVGPMCASFLATILVALFFSELVVWISHFPQAEALVAFAPGGVEAMSILALALQLDSVFVASHHIVRFVFIGIALPLLIRVRPQWFGLNEA
jgi:membrane AbrB-like protein